MIIGLTGKARSGKDTAADYLCSRYGFERYSLASPMKRAVCAMMEMDESIFDSTRKEVPLKLVDVSPRYMLQTLGTEWGRNIIGEDLWLKFLQNMYDKLPISAKVVVTDVRFENEAEWIRSVGGNVIHIESDPDLTERIDNVDHVSEMTIAKHSSDFMLYNPMSISEYHKEIDRLHKNILKPKRKEYDPPEIDVWLPEDDVKESGSIEGIQRDIVEWANEVFPNRKSHDALAKLIMEEIPEMINSGGTDPLEAADVFILMLDYVWLKDIDIIKAIKDKMAINRKRSWKQAENGMMRHE